MSTTGSSGGRKTTATVGEFMKAAVAAGIDLELVAGKKGLAHMIIEPAVNRPGLALTGFLEHFAHRRVQVLGYAEHDYLTSLDSRTQRERLEGVFKRIIPCVVVTRNRKVLPQLVKLADEYNVPVMRCPLITGQFVNAATMVMENLRAPKMTMQGTMVEILGIGVLIAGKPGIGKSEIALSLVKRGYSLVSDDVTALRLDSSGVIMGSALDATKFHMELRGLGIIHVPSLFGVASVRVQKRLDMIIRLDARDELPEMDIDGKHRSKVDVLGVQVVELRIPVAPGRDMAGLIEVAALDHKLRQLGHDAAKELDEQIIAVLGKGEDAGE